MAEHELQRFITELLRPLVARWLRFMHREGHAGADQFFYLYEGNLERYRAPDIYVIDGLSQDIPEVGSWMVWEGHLPHFAIEVCGSNWEKDYDEAPADYAEMGTQELVIFDPGATPRSRRRVRWQVYRRNARGAFRKALSSSRDRVRSVFLGCSLKVVDEQGHLRLRLATGDLGNALFPTEAEAEHAAKEAALADRESEHAAKEAALADRESERQRAESERHQKIYAEQRAEAERQRAEAERQRAEAERQRAEAERQRAQDALARIAALEAEIARLRS